MNRTGIRCCLGLTVVLWLAVGGVLADTVTGEGWNGAEPMMMLQPEGRGGNALDQGGDRCTDAVVITTLPFCDSGTTVGLANDYTPPCVTASNAPDAVYVMTPPVSTVITVSLCFSSYNTALHIWRGCPTSGGTLVCCNDDFCGQQSCCPALNVEQGVTYYVIVDGGAGGVTAGNYLINVVSGNNCPTAPCNPPQCPYPDADTEPLNNVCGPNVPQLSCPDTVCGEINPSTDADWYALTLTGSGCVELTVDVFATSTPGYYPFGLGLNSRVFLVAADCATVLAFDDDSGIGTDAKLDSLCLEPGLYYLRVDQPTPSAPGGPYVLALACRTCPCPADSCPYPNRDFEPNNVCATGNPQIFCRDTLCGDIEQNTSGDYYLLQVPTGGCSNVKLDVFGNDTPGWWPAGQGLDPVVRVYDLGCANLLGSDDNSGVGNDAHLELCLPAGLYHILVSKPTAASPPGPYILATYCEPCACPQDSCPLESRDIEPVNNTCGTFDPLVICGDSLCGEISAQTDVDWYLLQLQTAPCGQVFIDVFGNDTPGLWPFGQGLNPRVWLYANDCVTVLGMDDDGGIGFDSRLVSACLPPGFYMIKVEGAGAAAPSIGPYILTVHCTSCQCPQPCEVICSPQSIPEGEPCPNVPDFYNSGCDGPVPGATPFGPLACGTDVCGSAWADSTGARDHDWYIVETLEPDTMWFCVTAEYAVEILLYAPGPGGFPCRDLDTLDCDRALACSTACVGACVPPGRYFVQVRPAVGVVTPCATYWLRARCTICSPPACERPDSVVIYYPTIANPDIHLHWPPVASVTDYRVYRATTPDVPILPTTYLATTADTFYVDFGVTPGVEWKYFYAIVSHCKISWCGP